MVELEAPSISSLAREIGTSAFVAESVPFVLGCLPFLPQLGFLPLLKEVISCGGDTDTNASLVGQICGAAVGRSGLPRAEVEAVETLEGTAELVKRFSAFAAECASRQSADASTTFWRV